MIQAGGGGSHLAPRCRVHTVGREGALAAESNRLRSVFLLSSARHLDGPFTYLFTYIFIFYFLFSRRPRRTHVRRACAAMHILPTQWNRGGQAGAQGRGVA